jgi:hypothetical protein
VVGEKSGEAYCDPAKIESLVRILARPDSAEVGHGRYEAPHSGELVGPLAAGGNQSRQVQGPNSPPSPTEQMGNCCHVFPGEPSDVSDWQGETVVQKEGDLGRRPDRGVRAERQPFQETVARPTG